MHIALSLFVALILLLGKGSGPRGGKKMMLA